MSADDPTASPFSNALPALTATELVAKFGQALSVEQKKILRTVAERQSLFFTGAAGTGKSLTLRSIIEMLRFKYSMHTKALAVTASTGIAALNIGGETLHSFAGVKLGKKRIDDLLEMLTDDVRDKWRKLETLIIDEISMIDGTFFDKLEAIARNTRKNNIPFGGIQLVICGDFFQLPPVPDQYNGAQIPVTFAFEALTWRRCIPVQMQLTQVFRQTDSAFVEILNNMRRGYVDTDLEGKLRCLERDISHDGIEPIHIYPTSRQVDNRNTSRLAALSGDVFSNKAIDRGRWLPFELEKHNEISHQNRIASLLDRYCNAPRSITLKVGAQVMLIKNISQGRLVNGSLGRVVGFAKAGSVRETDVARVEDIIEASLARELADRQGHRTVDELRQKRLRGLPGENLDPNIFWPIVEFMNGDKVLFTPLPFDMEDAFGHLEATRVQVPLILAWAITIHKSQGQTIERLAIDFEGTFENGQAYVAMSRSTGLETLQVLNFRPMLVRAHPRVLEWNKQFLVEGEMDREEAIAAYFSHC